MKKCSAVRLGENIIINLYLHSEKLPKNRILDTLNATDFGTRWQHGLVEKNVNLIVFRMHGIKVNESIVLEKITTEEMRILQLEMLQFFPKENFILDFFYFELTFMLTLKALNHFVKTLKGN